MTIISTEMTYANAVSSLRPGCQFIAEASGITRWDSTDLEQPLESDIQAEIVKLQAEHDSLTYSRARRAEYAKLNQFEMQFDDQRDSTTTWVDAVNAIKAKYPKPS